ncbi:MAG: D-alanyl-alanine synthetase D-alanine-D-alanine ligase [Parcubacteria group bacterium]|nr:D-alanyl-alanine synthetase D-alanine-D-alanine ligase [Parcubacteria group bacterium]
MAISKIRVAVLRGGGTPTYEHSLDAGKTVLSLLREKEDAYEPQDIFVSKDGTWHLRGLPVEPHDALKYADVAWNTLGADTASKRILDTLGVHYIGGELVPSALSGNIQHARTMYEREGLPTTRFKLLTEDAFDDTELVHIFRNFLLPVTIRTQERGSTFSGKIARTYAELEDTVKEAFMFSKKIVVEELLKGKIAVASIIENARNERLYALLPAELKDGKVSSPGSFSTEEKRLLEAYAKRAHKALGLRHYSSSRFLITPRGKIYILETDTVPETIADSALSKSLKATGWKEREFVEHLLNLAKE